MSELTEFLLARIAEEEAWIERGRALGGGAVLWEEETMVQATRECEAKRRIVEACDNNLRFEEYGYTLAEGTLKALAAVYADHPDFDEAWRSTPEV